jgi:protein phosphatase
MIKASFGLTETGSVRIENQDSYLLDVEHGLIAVADGLGGLPNGARASQMALDILRKKLTRNRLLPLHEIITEVNEETRSVGYGMDTAGFGTTLTLARYIPEREVLEIGHVGDSAAIIVSKGKVGTLTVEHTVAARMVAEQWHDASDAIPLSAHHTLTQCIGQDLYIDPQLMEVPVQEGDRIFLVTDGVTKALPERTLIQSLNGQAPIGKIYQSLTFQIEAAGSPDNYTVIAVEF